MLGLIAGIGLVILREQLDNTVKENDEVEEIADAAVVLAQSGQRVALVEGDSRRPRVTKYLDIVSGTGLTNVLAGAASLEDVLQPLGDGKLTVLGSGPTPPNPSEMLGSAHMRQLITELREINDYVMIDSSPLRAGHRRRCPGGSVRWGGSSDPPRYDQA